MTTDNGGIPPTEQASADGPAAPALLPPYLGYGWLDERSIKLEGGALEAAYLDGRDVVYRVRWTSTECSLTESFGAIQDEGLGEDIAAALFNLGREQLLSEETGPPFLFRRMRNHLSGRAILDKPRRADIPRIAFPAYLHAWVTVWMPQEMDLPVPRTLKIPERRGDQRHAVARPAEIVRSGARIDRPPGGPAVVRPGRFGTWQVPALMVEEMVEALQQTDLLEGATGNLPHVTFHPDGLDTMWATHGRMPPPDTAWVATEEQAELGRAIADAEETMRIFDHLAPGGAEAD